MRTINQYSTAIFCAVFALCASIDGGPGSSQVSQEYWLQQAETKLLNRRARQGSREHQKRAKNVIIFIGDGMGPAVVTATRIYRGQKEKRDNDQDSLFWEEFPHGGLVKTHSLNQHVTDSGASATAIFYGRKVNSRTLGVDGTVRQNDCSAVDNGKIESIASMALKNGMSVGFVTTTLVTDATPAALFAHTAQRGIESDFDAQKFKLTGCVDIAKQLVDYYPGNQFKVILGGGSRKMMPNYTENNPEESELIGERLDGRNLVEDWKSGSGRRSVVWNRDELLDTDYNKTDFLMGMFAPKRFPYELDAALKNKTNYPTLSEMTEAAIKVLQKNPNGFLLLVEGALIDSALHANYAKFAVTETL
uniref:Alkaline phosphatase n=1 Tax=Plectus sambesii TaxID=2011161 RepID=A0A914VVK9_9BILA